MSRLGVRITGWGLVVVLAASVATAAPVAPATLTIGTNPPGTLFYGLGSGIARILTDFAGVRAVVQPYSGSSTFLPLLNTGELQLGVVNAVDVAMAYRGPDRLQVGGRNPFHPSPNIRLVVRGGPLYAVQWARRDSPFRTVADLRGRRVTGVYSAHLAVWYNTYGNLASCGLTWSDVQVVPVSTVGEGMRALVAGRADSAAYALGAADVQEADTTVGLRALSICGDDQGQRRLKEAVPGYYAARLKAGRSAGVVEDVWVQAYDIYLLTHKDLHEDTVYRVTRTLWEQNRKLWPLHSAFEEWATRRYADPGVTVPYHPGAIRLYREKGAWTRGMDEAQARLLQEAAR